MPLVTGTATRDALAVERVFDPREDAMPGDAHSRVEAGGRDVAQVEGALSEARSALEVCITVQTSLRLIIGRLEDALTD